MPKIQNLRRLWAPAILALAIAAHNNANAHHSGYTLAADTATRNLDLKNSVFFYDKLSRNNYALSQAAHAYLLAGEYPKIIALNHPLADILQALKAMQKHKPENADKYLAKIPPDTLRPAWAIVFIETWSLAVQGKQTQALQRIKSLGNIKALKKLIDYQIWQLHLYFNRAPLVLQALKAQTIETHAVIPYLQAVTATAGIAAALAEIKENPMLQNQKASALINTVSAAALGKTLTAPVEPMQAIAAALLHSAIILSDVRPQQALAYARLCQFANAQNNQIATDNAFIIADIFAGRGRYYEAVATLEKHFEPMHAETSQQFLSARIQMSDYLLRAGDRDAAEARLLRLRDNYPEHPHVREALANFYRTIGRYAHAVALYDEAIGALAEPSSKDWRLFYWRGWSYYNLGDWPNTEENLIYAHSLAPGNADVMNDLGYLWVDRGENLQAGLELLRSASLLRPKSGSIADSLGWAHYRLGDYSTAVKHLERAVSLSPQSGVITDHLGDAYWHSGRRFEARFQWRRALHLQDLDDKLRAYIADKLEQAEHGHVIFAPPGS